MTKIPLVNITKMSLNLIKKIPQELKTKIVPFQKNIEVKKMVKILLKENPLIMLKTINI